MTQLCATGVACANIALIKYWGNRNAILRLPSTGSISMTLGGLFTRARVHFDPELKNDTLIMNGQPVLRGALERVSAFLDIVRQLAGLTLSAEVVSSNNFPAGAGIASSASAFAAIGLAASRAAGLELSEADLSRLARRGSGSACRSVPGGFVEWQRGEGDHDSYAHTLAGAEHWPLADCIAMVEAAPKPVGSTEGHLLAESSPLQAARIADTPRRLELCRRAILERNFEALAEIAELDSNLMHAVNITSKPALFYWEPASVSLMKAIPAWRKQGVPVFYTLDAGPNVHAICPAFAAGEVKARLAQVPGVTQVLYAEVGGAARLEVA